ncbi:hypothetical protein bcere0025_54430 [Bacillus cereus F65185]|uniref:hypothetical protein n=1 Tax=Bacillus cereus TaxID=1396 RepID=UPI0001A0CE7A|nr:hypothetical protein [Bacillus cereus]EEL61830.1 hypothetical protein bcere0025_54430 [Bacillus cereus F65185]
MFHIDWPLVERVIQILKPYGIQVSEEPNGVRMRDLNGLLRLEEIPQEVQDEIRDALAEEDLRTYEEFQVFECYSCKEKGNEEFLIINGDSDITLSAISYDQTDWFSDKYIVETYRKKLIQTRNMCLKLIKTNGLHTPLEIQIVTIGF